jgi:hypothetical protein
MNEYMDHVSISIDGKSLPFYDFQTHPKMQKPVPKLLPIFCCMSLLSWLLIQYWAAFVDSFPYKKSKRHQTTIYMWTGNWLS